MQAAAIQKKNHYTSQNSQDSSSTASTTSTSTSTFSPSSLPKLDRKQIVEIAKAFQNVPVKDRTYHFITYKDCFVASEAVDAMMKAGVATSRENAVLLGRVMQTRHALFDHVMNEHLFEDKYLFFRFNHQEEVDSDVTPRFSVREAYPVSTSLRHCASKKTVAESVSASLREGASKPIAEEGS